MEDSDLDLKLFEDAYVNILTPVFIAAVRDLRIVLSNPSAAKSCGYRTAEMQGMEFFAIFRPEDKDRIVAMFEAGNDHGVYSEYNLTILRKSGRAINIDLTGRKIARKNGEIVIFTLHDITELKKTNDELELKVKLRTSDLEASKNQIQSILNSSQQGFLSFGPEQVVEGGYSLKASQMLGAEIEGKNVAEVLNLSRPLIENISILVFEQKKLDLLEQVSKMESEVSGKSLGIHFAPIFDEEKAVKRLLVTVTDVTPIKILKLRAEKSAKESRSLVKILQSKFIFLNVVQSLESIGQNPDVDSSDRISIKRFVHTVKGEFSFFECDGLVEICDSWEKKWAASGQVDISGDFEIFIQQMRIELNHFIDKFDSILKIRESDQNGFFFPIHDVKILISHATESASQSKGAENLLSALDTLLARPIAEGLQWLCDVWLLAAKTLGKKVDPIFWEDSVSLFVHPYEKLIHSMVHVVRNAADHGIESKEERLEQGKPESGKLSVRLELKDNYYHLFFNDDGRGLQLDRVKAKAQKLGLPIPENSDQLMQLVFIPEFSTKDGHTSTSGAGVGLNVVQEEARKLSGDSHISNKSSGGTELHVWFKKTDLAQVV